MRYSRQLIVAAALSVAAVGGVSACVGDDSSGTPDATTDAANDVTAQDVTTQDVQSSDVVNDGPTGCAARTADDTVGVFVAKSGSDVNSCGTRSNPCLTITYAIATAKAATGKTTIYVAAAPPETTDAGDGGTSPGVYAESITLDAPLSSEGGGIVIGVTWTPVCDATTSTSVTIQAVGNTTIAASFNGAATLRDLGVASKPSPDPGESLYGITVSGSTTNLTLDQVVVDVAGGGAGVGGTNGTPGVNASDAGCSPSTGAGGAAGAGGAGGAAGTFSSTGYVATSGGDGGVGGVGQAGTAGSVGQCMNSCDVIAGSCPNTCTIGTATTCGGTGLSGCPGGGGSPGSCGTGGGSSVAVYAWDAHVVVFGGRFTTGNGGNGGNGGAGGDGGAPTSGSAGSSATCASLTGGGCSNVPSPHCTATFQSGTPLNGGSAGGSGGAGGVGGHGGGGSGGDSYGFVQGGDGGVTLNGNPSITHGTGGTGGAVSGANGTAADRWP